MIIFSMNGVIGNVWGAGKNFKSLQVCFFTYLKVTSKQGVPEVSIIHFLPRAEKSTVVTKTLNA